MVIIKLLMHHQSHLEVVNESDLLLSVIGTEANPATPEHEVSELNQVDIFTDEHLDAVTVLIERRHEKLLEVHEFIHVLQGVRQT